MIDPSKVKPFSPNSPNVLSPKATTKISMHNPIMPAGIKEAVLWFLYPSPKARMLIGNAKSKIK